MLRRTLWSRQYLVGGAGHKHENGIKLIPSALPRIFAPLRSLGRPPLVLGRQFSRSRTLGAGNSDGASLGSPQLRKTALYDFHVKNGASMAPFGGYLMPIQYSGLSIGDSHRFTRENASLFDVSHMVQHLISGPSAEELLSRVTPSDLSSLAENSSILSCFLHPETGGIVDDTVITRRGGDSFYLVTNAACKEKDLSYLRSQISDLDIPKGKLDWQVLDNQGLLALQGPKSVDVLKNALNDPRAVDFGTFYFGQSIAADIRLATSSIPAAVVIARGGYTGEDGFEISIAPEHSLPVAESLMSSSSADDLRLAGLGARDSLRLEAGMCLYGHDLDDTTTPPEAGLSWVVAKSRRLEGGFHGSSNIIRQMKLKRDGGTGTTRKRVGLIVQGAAAREGMEIVDSDGESIGRVTSGCPSPTLGKNIAMAYVKTGHNKVGTMVNVLARGKQRQAEIVKMPFVPHRYWKEPTRE